MIALRLYRVLPKEHRLRLLNLVPPQRRLWLVRRLTRTPGRRSPAAVGTRLRLTDDHGAMRATVVAEASPTACWRRNLDAVVDVLENAGIGYFCLRPANDLTSGVAVGAADRERVLELLRSAPQLAGAVIRTGRVPEGKFRPARRQVTVVQVFFPLTDPAATSVIGSEVACEIEFWANSPGTEDELPAVVAPRRNGVGVVFPVEESPCRVTARALSAFHGSDDPGAGYRVTAEEGGYRSREEFATIPVETVDFPIDAVYTWVDGDDPTGTQRKNAALARTGRRSTRSRPTTPATPAGTSCGTRCGRWPRSRPWLRQIYLVTDDQVPPWLDPEHPRITVVRHREIFDDISAAADLQLARHRVPAAPHPRPGRALHLLQRRHVPRPAAPSDDLLPRQRHRQVLPVATPNWTSAR